MGTPVGAVQAANPQKGVKRSAPGQPTHVPGQLPGFRGRSVDPGAAVKAPKLRNGNLNNETSNVRIPYSRVCPLEFLSSYQGRLGPGDVLFTYKFPPGFVTARADFNNATLGVHSLSRVVGLDGLNRLLMQSGPNGWRLQENVFEAPAGGNAIDVFGADGTCQLSVLRDYHLDGVVISNDEPGAFTSSGSRDNALFNIAIQGPVETNNGFLMYEDEQSSRAPLGPDQRTYAQYNPLTGTINARTVEAQKPEKLAASETAAQRVKREKAAPALAGRRRAPGADDAPPCAGCLRGIPWVLTCGYCCGAFRDAVATNRQLAESPVQRKREGKAPAAVTGQPVFEDDAAETGHAVTVAMPLLAVG